MCNPAQQRGIVMQVTFTIQHSTPIEKRKPTIYEALKDRLGREPTNDELKAEVIRILREA
jgi:hypothetical protein